ncbi:hypothetical protein Ancab_035092 [Ancistrocladus abbreviatus]
MATQSLTEYERRRLENIRRNDEMMASLKIHSRLSELSAASKRQRIEKKSYKVSPEKKPKTETPIVIRRSLRARGMPPDMAGLTNEFPEPPLKPSKEQPSSELSPRVLGPLSMRDAYRGSGSDEALVRTICKEFKLDSLIDCEEDRQNDCNDELLSNLNDEIVGICGDNVLSCSFRSGSVKVKGSVDPESFSLDPENIARVVPGKIMVVRFFPTIEMTIIAAGNKFGDVGFWDVESRNEDDDGVYLYHPHSAPVSGIVVQPFSLTKMYTSSYDGVIRMMDLEKGVFNLVYSSEDAIFSLFQQPNDPNSIYFSEGRELLNMWDVRAGKASASWSLHESRINTIDFNSANINVMATSSTDGTACLWDLRKMDMGKPRAFRVLSHKRGVQSAYFSPSGSCLATTSFDDNVGVLSGANFEDISMIPPF